MKVIAIIIAMNGQSRMKSSQFHPKRCLTARKRSAVSSSTRSPMITDIMFVNQAYFGSRSVIMICMGSGYLRANEPAREQKDRGRVNESISHGRKSISGRDRKAIRDLLSQIEELEVG